jgi:mRNA-degrading endonuclease RelE of RelBE toxin-antitoxin system
MKDEVVTVRIEKKIKDNLLKLAKEERRDLSDYLRLILTDIANKKIKI